MENYSGQYIYKFFHYRSISKIYKILIYSTRSLSLSVILFTLRFFVIIATGQRAIQVDRQEQSEREGSERRSAAARVPEETKILAASNEAVPRRSSRKVHFRFRRRILVLPRYDRIRQKHHVLGNIILQRFQGVTGDPSDSATGGDPRLNP